MPPTSRPADSSANSPTEDEKKVVAALLGKLYISPASSEEKLRELYADVSEAVETNLVSDTTGRNALYKIHVSLGKIVNGLDQQKEAGLRRSTGSRSVSLAPEDVAGRAAAAAAENRTVIPEPEIKEEAEDEVEEAEQEEQEEQEPMEEDNDSTGTVMHTNNPKDVDTAAASDGDSLVSDLLDDDGDTIMG